MVQGVGYRFFAQRVADRLGVTGYVKNLSDGRVEIYAIGSPMQLESMREGLVRGPRSATISEVAAQDAAVDARYTKGFSIEHEGW
jgi:acylphosphatase